MVLLLLCQLLLADLQTPPLCPAAAAATTREKELLHHPKHHVVLSGSLSWAHSPRAAPTSSQASPTPPLPPPPLPPPQYHHLLQRLPPSPPRPQHQRVLETPPPATASAHTPRAPPTAACLPEIEARSPAVRSCPRRPPCSRAAPPAPLVSAAAQLLGYHQTHPVGLTVLASSACSPRAAPTSYRAVQSGLHELFPGCLLRFCDRRAARASRQMRGLMMHDILQMIQGHIHAAAPMPPHEEPARYFPLTIGSPAP